MHVLLPFFAWAVASVTIATACPCADANLCVPASDGAVYFAVIELSDAYADATACIVATECNIADIASAT